MKSRKHLQLIVATLLMTGFASDARAADALLFVSSFAGGEEGCISTFRLNLSQGHLERVQVARDVEHPFFMALSPGGRYLYSNHSKPFGGKPDIQPLR